jgi:hypothetical protein
MALGGCGASLRTAVGATIGGRRRTPSRVALLGKAIGELLV